MLSNVSDQNPVEQVTEVVQVAPTDQELSLVAVENEHAVTTSLRVAEVFGKQHKNVLRDIQNLECSDDFRKLNFEPSHIIKQLPNNGSKKLPMYYITRDGFMFLVMGFTGKTAAKWKEAYIKAFNEMEAKIRAEQMAKAIEEHDRKEAEVYDFINDLMAGLPEDVKVSASKVRSVQGTLEYLLNYCWIEDADE